MRVCYPGLARSAISVDLFPFLHPSPDTRQAERHESSDSTYELVMTPIHPTFQLSYYLRIPRHPKDPLRPVPSQLQDGFGQKGQNNGDIQGPGRFRDGPRLCLAEIVAGIPRWAGKGGSLSLHDGYERVAVYGRVKGSVGGVFDFAYCQGSCAGGEFAVRVELVLAVYI